MLGEGRHGAGDIHLLEDIPPQQVGGDLPGNGHHGDGVQICRGNAGYQIGGTGAGRHQAYPRLTRHLGIAGSHMARVLLGPYQGVSQGRRLTQHIRNRADGGAGISEDMLHSFPLQGFHQDLCSCHHHV